ncbi:YTH domain-containing protein, partial [Dimargaris cristalligena]
MHARYFVIKSNSELDLRRSLKHHIWASTDMGNKRLDKAFRENRPHGPTYLFFSVNASGRFCGMAEMQSEVDLSRRSTVWAQDKWNGVFQVRWTFAKDIANIYIRHILLANNNNKPITNSRDTQEIPEGPGRQMLKIFLEAPSCSTLL